MMELRFDAMLSAYLGNKNFVVGHIKRSHGPQVQHPCSIFLHLTFNFFYLWIYNIKTTTQCGTNERDSICLCNKIKLYNAILLFKLCTSRALN